MFGGESSATESEGTCLSAKGEELLQLHLPTMTWSSPVIEGGGAQPDLSYHTSTLVMLPKDSAAWYEEGKLFFFSRPKNFFLFFSRPKFFFRLIFFLSFFFSFHLFYHFFFSVCLAHFFPGRIFQARNKCFHIYLFLVGKQETVSQGLPLILMLFMSIP